MSRPVEQPSSEESSISLAIALKLSAVGLFSVMGALVKGLDGTVPPGQVVFARSFFALLPIAWLVWHSGGLRSLRTQRPVGHALRSMAGLIAMFCGFTALTLAPLADVTAINFAATVFTPMLAAIILREHVGIYRWSAVAVGFFGILIMLQPAGLALLDGASNGLGRESLGHLLALTGALFVALATIAVRALATREEPAAIIFWFTLSCTVVAALTLPLASVWPTPWQAFMLVAIGVLGGIAQILMTRAYVHAPASVIAPFDYTAMVYATLIGVLIFGDRLAVATGIGAVLVIGAGLFIFYRERYLGLPRGRARARAVGPPGPPTG